MVLWSVRKYLKKEIPVGDKFVKLFGFDWIFDDFLNYKRTQLVSVKYMVNNKFINPNKTIKKL